MISNILKIGIRREYIAFVVLTAVNLWTWFLEIKEHCKSSEYSQEISNLSIPKLPFLSHHRLLCIFSLGFPCPTTIGIPAIFNISKSDEVLIKT